MVKTYSVLYGCPLLTSSVSSGITPLYSLCRPHWSYWDSWKHFLRCSISSANSDLLPHFTPLPSPSLFLFILPLYSVILTLQPFLTCVAEPVPFMPWSAFFFKKLAHLLGCPKIIWVFHDILSKNPKELFSQPNIIFLNLLNISYIIYKETEPEKM